MIDSALLFVSQEPGNSSASFVSFPNFPPTYFKIEVAQRSTVYDGVVFLYWGNYSCSQSLSSNVEINSLRTVNI